MMKSPDKIKKSLRIHTLSHRSGCIGCAYCGDNTAKIPNGCADKLFKDVREYIKQLEADNARLREKDTPKPCEHKAALYKCLTCPSCSNVVSQHEMWGETEVRILPKYCKFCGQRIELPKEA